MRCTSLAFWLLALAPLSLMAQGVYVSRLAADNYLEGPVYQVELFNPSARPQELGGWLIATRQFALMLPKGTRIGPLSGLKLGKAGGPGRAPDLLFEQIPDFLVRFPNRREAGEYVALFNSRREFVEGFYVSESAAPGFLPDPVELITTGGQKLALNTPAETDPRWRSLRIAPDPAMAFVRLNNQWQATSRRANTLPATEYGEVSGKYLQGVVRVEALARFERDCLPHVLERSANGAAFVPVDTARAVGNSEKALRYQLFDDRAAPGQHYYYRVRNTDRFGNTVYSPRIELSTDELAGDFSLEVFFSRDGGPRLNVRIASRLAQPLLLKVLDEQFREISILYAGELPAGSRNLIRLERILPAGRYYVVADTGRKRYYEQLTLAP